MIGFFSPPQILLLGIIKMGDGYVQNRRWEDEEKQRDGEVFGESEK